ncbi:MAG: sterol desaturase family protein [Solirubrobacterales bacterium]|nr:sterol desaturase family protein [Solirubrobacterales bacterium]
MTTHRPSSIPEVLHVSRTERLRASPPLFTSPALDRLTRVHHLVPVAIYAPVVVILALLAVRAQGVPALAGLAAGYALWTFTEYWLHRVVFHFEPQHPVGRRLHFLAHGVHHDHPNDPKRLVMPPSVSLPVAALFGAVFLVVAGTPVALGLFAGFLLGYLIYDELHFFLHHGAPRSSLGRSLRERHLRHHFQDHTRGFGVSAPYWDAVFGTASRARRRVLPRY